MADTSQNNGNEHTEKTEWTPASFRALRDALKRPGVITIAPWPEVPEMTIDVDMSGMGSLILAGKIPNKAIVESQQRLVEVGEKINQDQDNPMTWHDASKAIMDYHDVVLGALIVRPRYYMMDQLTNGLSPDDGVCIFDFTPEMRSAIVDVANSGGEALATFRKDPYGYSIALSEQRLSDDTSGDDTTTDDSVVVENPIQSGDLVEGESRRTRTSKTSRTGDEASAPEQIAS